MYRPSREHMHTTMAAAVWIVILLAGTPTLFGAVPGEIGADGSIYAPSLEAVRSVTYGQTPLATGAPNVAIVASASGDVTDPWFTDPRDRLIASGQFASVTVINAGQVTPSVAELGAFDAVLVWSNFAFADASALGDSLADYVNNGGSVVVAVFANSSSTFGRYLSGRWLTHDYEIIPSAGGTTTGPATLGTIHVPEHPLIQGVVSFSGGSSSFRPTTTAIQSPSLLIAEWDDGATLAAVREDAVGGRIDLGFYPPSDAVLAGFWDSTTDGDVLLVNALVYGALRPPLVPGDSDGDGDVDADDFAKFESCFTGADGGIVPAGCVTFDSDRDDDVDCSDWVQFTLVWTGPGDPPEFLPCAGEPIPTVSEWGMAVMTLLLLASATIVLRRRLALPHTA